MGRYLTTSLLVILCFLFFLLADLGLLPDYIGRALPKEVWSWLLVISIIVLALTGIGILPLSDKK